MRSKRQHVLEFSAPIQAVFPLFTPVNEKKWAHDWNPTLVYTDALTADEQGVVFTTQHPGEPLATWILTDYDPVEYRLTYAKFVPDMYVTLIEIGCSGGETTRVHVSYTLTALSDSGQSHVQSFTEAYFRHHFMAEWQRAIDHYLKSGNTLSS